MGLYHLKIMSRLDYGEACSMVGKLYQEEKGILWAILETGAYEAIRVHLFVRVKVQHMGMYGLMFNGDIEEYYETSTDEVRCFYIEQNNGVADSLMYTVFQFREHKNKVEYLLSGTRYKDGEYKRIRQLVIDKRMRRRWGCRWAKLPRFKSRVKDFLELDAPDISYEQKFDCMSLKASKAVMRAIHQKNVIKACAMECFKGLSKEQSS